MRFLAFILILVCLRGLPANAQRVDASTRQKVLDAKTEALRVIRDYSQNTQYNPEMRETARLMADSLAKASTSPAGRTVLLESCIKHPNAVADTGWIIPLISICPYGLASTKNDLIQTFIHEAYHLYEGAYYMPNNYPELYEKMKKNPNEKLKYPKILEASEKRASIMELEIMQKTYGCVFTETSYFEDLLGLKKNKDFFICK